MLKGKTDCSKGNSKSNIILFQLQLDGIELKKIYTLNPLAPEFIPRKYKELKEISPAAPNHITPVPPPAPVVPPTFPLTDYRFFPPVLYPQQPRPFVFNIIPPVPPIHSIPNGFSQPIRMVNPSLIVSPRQVVGQPVPPAKITTQPQNNAILTGAKSSGPAQSSNKLIQFMNNVHFPEVNVLNDYINLLPQNMSLADMLLQPPNVQERWYNYLKETIGVEAAEKFKYLLHAANQKESKILDKSIFERSTPQSCESPTFSWYDSPTNQINFNKPVYMAENVQNETSSSPQDCMTNKKPEIKPLLNGLLKHSSFDKDLQRHINEEFSSLNIESSDVSEVFKAFTYKNNDSHHGSVYVNSGSVSEPRFYKYFH